MEIRQTRVEDLVKQLDDLISTYYCRAKAAYQGIPEALSVMFLTIMELWVALDDIAGQGVQLLREYDPGVRPDLLNPLLLPRKIKCVAYNQSRTIYFVESRVQVPDTRQPSPTLVDRPPLLFVSSTVRVITKPCLRTLPQRLRRKRGRRFASMTTNGTKGAIVKGMCLTTVNGTGDGMVKGMC